MKFLKKAILECRFEENVIMLVDRKPQPVSEVEQEKKEIKGTVTDDQGVPLPGVSVVIKGTSVGVATDIDGKYAIEVENDNAVLVFSFVGMLPQEIIYKGQLVQNVSLTTDTEQMDEVVVTGYQIISKERATGSFVTLQSDNMNNSPNETIGDNLESLVAGIQSRVDEEGNTIITVRGQSSLTGASEPLVVVDGFAIEGGFETINRKDIDKVTVLKDAAAASIWGARAANGVIVITTKKGNKNKGINVSFEAYTKISEDVDLDYVNPIASSENQLKYEMYLWQMGYIFPSTGFSSLNNNFTQGGDQFEKQYLDHVSSGASGSPNFTLDTPELQKLKGQSYKKQVKDLMLRKPVSQNYNLSLRGQGENNNYALSVMYNTNKKVMQADKDDNILINFRNSMKVADWLQFDFSVMTQFRNDKSGGIGLGEIKNMAPYDLLLDENGNYNHIAWDGILNKEVIDDIHETSTGWSYDNMIHNPLQNMRSQDFRAKTVNTRINTGLKFKIADGINYDVKMQYSRGNIDIKNRYKEESYFVRSMVNRFDITDFDALLAGTSQTITEHQLAKGEIVYVKNIQTKAYVIRNQFSFDRVYGDHAINFIAGTELNWNESESKDDWLYGYNHEKYTTKMPSAYSGLRNAYAPSYIKASIKRGGVISYGTNKFFSLFSNFAYTFKDKYTLSGSVRTDASNLTVKESKYRYSPFWSVGGGWQLGKEDFMNDCNWLNRAILRATYGVNGNTPQQTAQVPLINYVSSTSGYTGGTGEFAILSDLGNPTLGWEKVKVLNVALDFAVFDNKLYGSIDYYNKTSQDLVVRVAMPSIAGNNSQSFNVANMENNGIEINLNANVNITRDLSWNPVFNFAYNKSMVSKVKLTSLPAYLLGAIPFVEGYPFSPVWYIKKSGTVNENGIPTVLGKNGKEYPVNVSLDNTGVDGLDLFWHKGSRIAPYVASFTNEFKYKGFSLLTTLTGKFGHYMHMDGFSYNNRGDMRNCHEDLNDIINGRAEEQGLFSLPENKINGLSVYGSAMSYLDSKVQSASYVRLKELMLSYSLPKALVSKIGASNIKFYTHISNVGLLWTANNDGYDPEYPKGGNFFKPERTYTLGVNVNF